MILSNHRQTSLKKTKKKRNPAKRKADVQNGNTDYCQKKSRLRLALINQSRRFHTLSPQGTPGVR